MVFHIISITVTAPRSGRAILGLLHVQYIILNSNAQQQTRHNFDKI